MGVAGEGVAYVARGDRCSAVGCGCCPKHWRLEHRGQAQEVLEGYGEEAGLGDRAWVGRLEGQGLEESGLRDRAWRNQA